MEHKNFLQSPEFAKWRELCGDEVQEVAGNYMVVKNTKRGRRAEIAGAIIGDLPYFTEQVRAAGERAGCVYVRVRPQLLGAEDNLNAFAAAGFKSAPRHLYAENTVILDLAKTEDELLAGMRKQTRYEIKHLDRFPQLEIECIRSGNNASLAAWENFAKLQTELAERQGFVPPSKSELQNLREAFWDKALLYVAKNAGKVLAYALVIVSGDEADYFEAASAEEAREIPVAYALQWRIIRDMKAEGLHYYNLFGIAPNGAKHHRYAKLTTFKRGFGGEVVNYVPAQDLPINKTKYFWLHLHELAVKRRMKW
jgi:lipid II:glycine glycyltransferase (peptidoglycan interpeptide bridge formation enzyme)